MEPVDWNEYVQTILQDPIVQQGLSIARFHGATKMYVVGGAVYRRLITTHYKTPQSIPDVDILIDKLNYPLKVQSGWNVTYHTGSWNEVCKGPGTVKQSEKPPRFSQNNKHIDLLVIDQMHGVAKGAEDGFGRYLKGVPLTTQSIGIDVEQQLIWGEAGIESLDNRIVAINNLAEAEYVAKVRYGTDIETYVRKKALSIGFGYALIDRDGTQRQGTALSRFEQRRNNESESQKPESTEAETPSESTDN